VTETLITRIIIIITSRRSSEDVFSIILLSYHTSKTQNKTIQKYQYLILASLILEVCYINSFKRHFSTIQWIRLFNECYVNFESYFISVTIFRLVCLLPIVAYVLSFIKHNFYKMKLVFITISIWSSSVAWNIPQLIIVYRLIRILISYDK
jgi:hypothetical protein